MEIKVVIDSEVSTSMRARQLGGMFDMPIEKKLHLEWQIKAPLEEREWNVGLITGPSGAGKSTIARQVFGETPERPWTGLGVIDDFDKKYSIGAISEICQAVGFNTVPAWLRPYAALSTGEKFRVNLARMMLESEIDKPIVYDEFTSVVDRQVAKIASHAVQKWIRKNKRQFVAVSCHYDIIEWLQPDWVIDASAQTFEWRLLQRRPQLEVTISPVPYSTWNLFAPFHYMSAELHRGARCFGLFVEDRIAAFAGVLYRPISHKGVHTPMYGVSRIVTLPDFQGIGLAFVLMDQIGAWYKARGAHLNMYPAHPALIRAMDRSKAWGLIRPPGRPQNSSRTTHHNRNVINFKAGRPSAVFRYVGPTGDRTEADKIFAYWNRA